MSEKKIIFKLVEDEATTRDFMQIRLKTCKLEDVFKNCGRRYVTSYTLYSKEGILVGAVEIMYNGMDKPAYILNYYIKSEYPEYYNLMIEKIQAVYGSLRFKSTVMTAEGV